MENLSSLKFELVRKGKFIRSLVSEDNLVCSVKFEVWVLVTLTLLK